MGKARKVRKSKKGWKDWRAEEGGMERKCPQIKFVQWPQVL